MKRFNDNQNDLEYKREQRNKEINDRFGRYKGILKRKKEIEEKKRRLK